MPSCLPAEKIGVPEATGAASTAAATSATISARPVQPSFEDRCRRITEQLVDKLDLSLLGSMDPDNLRRELRPVVEHLVDQEEAALSPDERDRIVVAVLDETFGFGPLEELLRDPQIAEICVHGPQEIWLRRRQGTPSERLEPAAAQFRDREHLARALERLTSRPAGGAEQSVLVSRKLLPNGWQLCALTGAFVPDGPLLRLQAPAPAIGASAMSACEPRWQKQLHEALAARRRILVCGPAGGGKTTLVEALVQAIPPGLRVVVLEQFSHLRIDRPQVVRLLAEPGPLAGPADDVRNLASGARELRPDWLIVDELADANVSEIVAAAMCDDCGILATLRARDPRLALCRLEGLHASSRNAATLEQIRRELCLAFDLVVHVERQFNHEPRIAGVFDSPDAASDWHFSRSQ